nr:MAG TPA: hypothetical protein [Caudoviricetes sp.]
MSNLVMPAKMRSIRYFDLMSLILRRPNIALDNCSYIKDLDTEKYYFLLYDEDNKLFRYISLVPPYKETINEYYENKIPPELKVKVYSVTSDDKTIQKLVTEYFKS